MAIEKTVVALAEHKAARDSHRKSVLKNALLGDVYDSDRFEMFATGLGLECKKVPVIRETMNGNRIEVVIWRRLNKTSLIVPSRNCRVNRWLFSSWVPF
jgi:hypothetical protein